MTRPLAHFFKVRVLGAASDGVAATGLGRAPARSARAQRKNLRWERPCRDSAGMRMN